MFPAEEHVIHFLKRLESKTESLLIVYQYSLFLLMEKRLKTSTFVIITEELFELKR